MGSEQNDGTSFPPAEPKLCVNGCGFFGTAANMNLCSKCYRDLRAEEEQAASAKAAMEKTLNINPKQHIDSKVVVDAPQVVVAANSVQSDVSAKASSSAETVVAGGDQVPSKPANRCFSCNKKVGLTGFKCKCGGTYCGTHRYAENHECLFDFKGAGRDAIAKANPVIKANKVESVLWGVVGTRRRAPSECIRGLWMVDSLIKWINVAIYSEWLSSFASSFMLPFVVVPLYMYKTKVHNVSSKGNSESDAWSGSYHLLGIVLICDMAILPGLALAASLILVL
ncbi:hypothetical protein POTOM_013861 [Populus tomentosa]|uniref:A20/AN1-like zinc finger family protein n=1 Tax=Populus tomentosa TaxID=118781 RepID=A0A8X8CYV0_POPTO|nr:hypothetical protein POTOM_013861 [Populus tomentosa]